MADYSKLTTEAFENKINSSSDRVKKFFNSDEFVKRVSEISDTHNFDLIEREYLAFHKLAAATILGFISPDELPREILEFIDTDPETAASATKEVRELITELSHAESTNTPAPPLPNQTPNQTPAQIQNRTTPQSQPHTTQSENPNPPTQPQPPAQQAQPASQPTPKPQETQPPTPQQPQEPESPFVLQKRDEVKSDVETDIESKRPIRPSFYEAPSTSQKTEPENPAPKVKVDLGTEKSESPQSIPKKRDYTIHTPVENTTKDTGPITEEQEKSQVHPENVVDLKDLPK